MKLSNVAAAVLVALAATAAQAQDNAPAGITAQSDAMIFYVAHGAPGACGPNCADWIAAEGVVQWDTFKRLMALLDRIEARKLPVILNVRGEGSLNVATTLGKIIRQHGLDVGAGATRVASCAGKTAAECLAFKRGGVALEASLDASAVECDIVCVLILAGGVNRTLPADAKVTIGPAQIRNRLAPNVSEAHQEGLQARYGELFRLYLIQMGVIAELVDIVDRNTEARRVTVLKRDDWLRLRLVTALAL